MYKLKVMRPLNQLSVRRFVSPVRFSASLCLAAALLLLASSSGESSAQGIANNFTPTGVSGGGRLLSASLNPLNPSQAMLVCDMMGLYRTEDEGLRWQMNAANGFVASNPSTTSDQLLKFTGDALPGTSGYDSYWYFQLPASNPYWTTSANSSLSNFSNVTDFLPRHRGFFVLSRNMKSNWIVLTPWTP